MTDHILEEIKTATGWNQVVKKDSGYVITFQENDAYQIQGLSKNDTTFFLTFEGPIPTHLGLTKLLDYHVFRLARLIDKRHYQQNHAADQHPET